MSKIALSPNASGTGTLTIAAPNTNSDRTLTLPDNTGTVLSTASNITAQALNGPAFLAYAASQSLSAGVSTKITLNSEQFDTNNCFDPTTNYRFTPNVAGYYQFSCVVRTNNGGAGEFSPLIFKNGANVFQGTNAPTTTLAISGAVASCLIYLNGTTDYVEFFVYTTTACTTASGNSTQLSGFLARAA